jgi:ketosteroid isomerase-like protein
MRVSIVGFALAVCLAGQALAQAPAGAVDPMAAITRFTDAVNRSDMAGALSHLGPSPTLVDDLAPYRWQGPGAGGAWMAAMGANAQAKGMTVINMRLGKASRIEVEGDRAYAVVPGVLTYTLKDGHQEHADGVLTFTLQHAADGWKIDALTWTGPPAKP